MQIGMIAGMTRIIGKSQGFLGLPLKDELVDDPVTGPKTPCMTSAWLPTPTELDALMKGAAVHVRIYGVGHPPIMVLVGDVPE